MAGDQNKKKDAGKRRWDLLPVAAVESIVDVLGFGAAKYCENGWVTVDKWRPRYYAATLRHLFAWWRGEKTDAESGLPHLSHALCCLVFLFELDKGATTETHRCPLGIHCEARHGGVCGTWGASTASIGPQCDSGVGSVR